MGRIVQISIIFWLKSHKSMISVSIIEIKLGSHTIVLVLVTQWAIIHFILYINGYFIQNKHKLIAKIPTILQF